MKGAPGSDGGRRGRGTPGGRRGSRSGAPSRRGDGAVDRRPPVPELGGEQVEGRRSVRELLATGRRPVHRIVVADGQDPSTQLDEIEELASRRRVRVETVSRARFGVLARTESAQGVLALARPVQPIPLDDLCQPGAGPRREVLLLVVAGVTDPGNLGALLRSAECAGVSGIVLPRHRTARLSPSVTKVAAGAIEHLRFATVGGIPSALERLSTLGIWTIGLAPEVPRSLYQLTLGARPVALVVGGEERGLAPLVRRRCDEVVSIPQLGALASLNVGAAGAVACFEAARQRIARGAVPP